MADIRAVLLDMDGTLVDSNAAVARAWAYWSALRSVSLAEIARVTPGRPATESIAELAPWLSPAERAADAEELLRRERADVVDIGPTRAALAVSDLDARRGLRRPAGDRHNFRKVVVSDPC